MVAVNMVELTGFDELLQMLIKGDLNGALRAVFAGISDSLFSSLTENREYLLQILMVAVLAAFFTNLTTAFDGGLLGEHGFYVSFLMIFALAVRAFSSFYEIGQGLMARVVDTVKVMLPAYVIAVTGAGGSFSGTAAYELMSMVLGCIQYFILYVLFPMVQVYFLFQFINQLNKEQYFTKWMEMLKGGVNWCLKTISVFVIGMHLLKGLISPMVDAVKVGSIQKGISALPGGSFVAAFTGVFLGCSVLIKNCVGVAGILILLGIVAVPLLKMTVLVAVYKLFSALLEPVIDKRLSKALSGIHDAGALLLRISITSVVLLIVSIALIAACTNTMLYSN